MSTLIASRLDHHIQVRKLPGKELGRLVAQKRRALGLSQDDLARAIQLSGTPVSRETIASIERGVVDLPGREILRGVSQHLEIPISSLLVAAQYLDPLEAGDYERAERLRLDRDRLLAVARQLTAELEGLPSVPADQSGPPQSPQSRPESA